MAIIGKICTSGARGSRLFCYLGDQALGLKGGSRAGECGPLIFDPARLTRPYGEAVTEVGGNDNFSERAG